MTPAELEALAAAMAQGDAQYLATQRLPALTLRDRSSMSELRREEIAKQAERIAAATRTLILTGHIQTLHDFANAVGDRLSEAGVCEGLVRTALACGPIATGAMFTQLLNDCITADADAEAVKEVARMESHRVESAADLRAGRIQHDREMAAA